MNAALLYRLASGDSNDIHVDPSQTPALVLPKQQQEHDDEEESNNKKSKQPQLIVHGLYTLGVVARMLIQHSLANSGSDSGGVQVGISIQHMEAQFVKPVCVGDSIVIQCWKKKTNQPQQKALSTSYNSSFRYVTG